MGKVKYIKCPRCELNYIPDTEDMCDVCKAEMGLSSRITLLDDMIDEDEPTKLCPICKTAYIGMDEDMCENCLAVSARTDELEAEENDDDWRAYMDDEVDGLFDVIKRELIELIHQNSDMGAQALDLLMIAKYFERIGDHAVNIAEWVEFAITGVHKGEKMG